MAHFIHRGGLGADPIEAMVSGAVERVLASSMPRIQEAAAKAAESARPMVSRVIREDEMPYVVGGIALGAALSAFIGAWMATRR